MGWFANYTALEANGCSTREELLRKNPLSYVAAENANVPDDRDTAWATAEKEIAKRGKRKAEVKKS